MGKITYYNGDNKNGLYVNIVPRYNCTNRCVFCERDTIEDAIGEDLYLKRKPTLTEITRSIDAEFSSHIPSNLIFCGLGEPTIYLTTLVDVIRYIKDNYSVSTRLNTNGQGNLIHKSRLKEGENVPLILREAGLDTISVSLNSTSKEQYNRLHIPKNPEESFPAVLEFIEQCNQAGLETTVSFLELENFDQVAALEFMQQLGIKKEQVRFREKY